MYDSIDIAEHTIFACRNWRKRHTEAYEVLGRELGPGSLKRIMLESKERWDVIANLICDIMRCKENEEKKRQDNQTLELSIGAKFFDAKYSRFNLHRLH